MRTHTMRTHTRAAFAAATALTLALATVACTSDDTAADAPAPLITFDDGWAKATDSSMSGVFGTISNPGETDVHLTGVSGELGGSTELHETVPGGGGMMMQEKEDGFQIPVGGELILAPGGNHIMLMELDAPITTGQEITLTLEFDGGAEDGGTEQDITVSARDFRGGEEEYVGGGHGGMESGGMAGGDTAGADTEHGGMDHDG